MIGHWRFYSEVIGPMLDVPQTAGLIREGSEVVGYDRTID